MPKNTDIVIANDFHVPFHDRRTVMLFLAFIRRHQPDEVVLNGDIGDFYEISRFKKDPNRVKKQASLLKEIKAICGFLEAVRNAAGKKARITYIEGNHEERLKTYIWTHADALAWVKGLEMQGMLKMADYGIEYEEDAIERGDLLITHGTRVSIHAGYSAKREYDKNGCTGISGHTHRDGKYSIRTRKGQFAWWENYCMCNLKASYIKGVTNWSQGFSYVTLVGRRPFVEQLAIIGHKYIYGGRVFS